MTLAATGAAAVLAGTSAPVVAPLVAALTWRLAGRATSVGRSGRPDPSVPLVLDLVAAALRAGRPTSEAVAAAAAAADGAVAARFERSAALLRLGAPAEQAWAGLADGDTAAVAVTAVRSAASGSRLATAFERLARELRDDAAAADASRAHRCGVLAMVPLGLCFLPSFVLLGVVPVVVGIARGVMGAGS
ncbi:type II secretion system F family protein [Jatrophihabitans fulvus]